MVKVIALLKRNPSLSHEEFIRRYEGEYALKAAKHMPGWSFYVRRYIKALGRAEHTYAELPFDVITETWLPDFEAVDAMFEHLSRPEVAAELAVAKKDLFDGSDLQPFIVDERESVLPASA
jgi:hypothetical protein